MNNTSQANFLFSIPLKSWRYCSV